VARSRQGLAGDGDRLPAAWLGGLSPAIFRPLRPLITRSLDKDNVRTMAALKAYAEANR
jgi:hypothetical protein